MIRNSEFLGGVFWLGIGAYVIHAGRDMGLGGLHEPGPGFAFYWVGILMCALAASVIGQALLVGGPTLASLWAGTRWGKVLAVVGLLLVDRVACDAVGLVDGRVVLLLEVAGIYYGSMYGGSTTSILVNIPGEAASVVTCIDGHEMAKQGRAGPALGMAALASFAAGTFAVLALMLVAPSLARVAIAFGPPEYFSLMLLGLTILSFLSQGSMAKSLLMAAVGLVLGLIGMDQITAQPRLTFDRLELLDGVGLIPIVMGLFGVAEILSNLEQELEREVIKARIGGLWPSLADWAASKWAILRGTVLGFF